MPSSAYMSTMLQFSLLLEIRLVVLVLCGEASWSWSSEAELDTGVVPPAVYILRLSCVFFDGIMVSDTASFLKKRHAVVRHSLLCDVSSPPFGNTNNTTTPPEIAIEKEQQFRRKLQCWRQSARQFGTISSGPLFRCFLRYQRTEQLDDAAQINIFHYDPSLSYTAFDSRNMVTNQEVLETEEHGEMKEVDVTDVLRGGR